MDPKPVVGVSDYATFANNPILYTDPLGDKGEIRGTSTDEIERHVAFLTVITGSEVTYKIREKQDIGAGMKKIFVADIIGIKPIEGLKGFEEEQKEFKEIIDNKKTTMVLLFDGEAERGGGGSTVYSGDSKSVEKTATVRISPYYINGTDRPGQPWLMSDGSKQQPNAYSTYAHEIFGHALDHVRGITDYLQSLKRSNGTVPKEKEEIFQYENARLENKALTPENRTSKKLGLGSRSSNGYPLPTKPAAYKKDNKNKK